MHLLKPLAAASITLGLALTCCVTAPAATAPATAPVPHGTVTLISETTSLAPQHETWLGLHFVLEPGWHTYWANPGDSGTPPHLTWKLPAGFEAGPISWAVPERLPLSGGLTDYGYLKDVTLLVPIKGGASASPAPSAEVNVQISIVVCKDLCIPGKANVAVALPVRAAPPSVSNANTALFAAARNRLPKPLPAGWAVQVADSSKNEFLLTAAIGKQASGAFFFPLDESQVSNAASQPVEATPKGFRLRLKKSDELLKPIARLRGVLTLDGTGYLVDAPVTGAGGSGR